MSRSCDPKSTKRPIGWSNLWSCPNDQHYSMDKLHSQCNRQEKRRHMSWLPKENWAGCRCKHGNSPCCSDRNGIRVLFVWWVFCCGIKECPWGRACDDGSLRAHDQRKGIEDEGMRFITIFLIIGGIFPWFKLPNNLFLYLSFDF